MGTEPRTEAVIRAEIAHEQEELATAVAALRHDLEERRGPARRALVLVAAGIAAIFALKVVRRARRGRGASGKGPG